PYLERTHRSMRVSRLLAGLLDPGRNGSNASFPSRARTNALVCRSTEYVSHADRFGTRDERVSVDHACTSRRSTSVICVTDPASAIVDTPTERRIRVFSSCGSTPRIGRPDFI